MTKAEELEIQELGGPRNHLQTPLTRKQMPGPALAS